jgi:hypothetical protein
MKAKFDFLAVGILLAVVSKGPCQPVITTQPSSHSAVAGESATIGVVSTGTPPLAYQWSFNAQPLVGATQSSLIFTSVQFSNAGTYSVLITNLAGSTASQGATLAVVAPTLFSRVTNGPVATDAGGNTGCVWADFNNDGFLDLYVAQYSGGTNYFYRNNGDGTFARITQGGFQVNGAYNLGVSAVDYDNDGYLDLIVAAGGGAPSPRRMALFHNNGDGTFSRVSAGGITNQPGYFTSGDWADYDHDGFVDLFVSNSGSTNELWHNNRDGTFAKVTTGPIANDPSADPAGGLWCDYDNDGLPDLLVLNLVNNGRNYLYHNDGNGNFTRNLTNVITTDVLAQGSEGGDWGDYDNDGLEDLFIADFAGVANRLYHNNGGGSFSRVYNEPMLVPPAGTQPHVASWLDYDNDGYLDLFVSYADHNSLYRNNHDGTFSEIRSTAISKDTLSGNSFFNTISCVDYDNDGFLDLYVTAGDSSGANIRNLLYHNSGNSNGWLEVKLVGTASNRSAIGAKIRVQATIGGQSFRQVRELKSSGGWGLATPLVAHFGLGDATNAETVRIEWPSGIVQTLTNVAPKQILTVVEHQVLGRVPSSFSFTDVSRAGDGSVNLSVTGNAGLLCVLEASTNLVDWTKLAVRSNATGGLQFADLEATNYARRFYRVSVP